MPITASDAVNLLLASGLPVEVKSFSDVKIAEQNLRLRIRQQPPTPSAIENDRTEGLVLYVVPRITDGLRKVARDDPRIAFAAIQDGIVIFNGQQLDGHGASPEEPRPQPRRTPWVRYALLRTLIRTRRPRTQTELAKELGGTQAAVSVQLRKMDADVQRVNGGWVATEPEDIAEQFLTSYPGAKGISQHWFSHHPVVDQVRRITEVAPDVLVSGDVGADDIAPWRSPRHAVIYAHAGLSLATIGFAEADEPSGSLTVTVPADPTIWATAEAFGSNRTVDPLLCAYDVKRSAGPDVDEAVQHILDRTIESWMSID